MTRDHIMMAGLALSLGLNFIALTGVYRSDARPPNQPDQAATLAKLEHKISKLERQLSQIAKTPTSTTTPGLADAASEQGGASPDERHPRDAASSDSASMREAIANKVSAQVEDRVDRKLERAMSRQRHRNNRGEWEPPIDDLARELELSPEQQERATEIFNDARDATFAILSTKRDGGGHMLDDLATNLKEEGSPELAMGKFVKKLFVEKVPGTDKTYIEEMIALRGQVMTQFRDELDDDQQATLQALKIDPLSIKTGYDPARDYVESRVKPNK